MAAWPAADTTHQAGNASSFTCKTMTAWAARLAMTKPSSTVIGPMPRLCKPVGHHADNEDADHEGSRHPEQAAGNLVRG